MRYADIRSGVQTGDLLAWQGTGLWSRLIRWWTGSPWSHVGLAYWLGPRLMVLESYPGKGVRMRPLSHDLPAWVVPAGVAWSQAAEDYALELLDAPYSWTDCLRVAFGLRPTGRGLECAEYAANVLWRAGLRGLPEAPTPANLAAAMPQRPGLIEP